MTAPLALIGCGEVFEAIAAEPPAYGLDATPQVLRIESVAHIAAVADELLGALPPGSRLFVAVDAQALNFARLELYGRARLRGFPLATLVHRLASVSLAATLADNCYVGPGAVLAAGVRVAADGFIGARARLDAGVTLAGHVWIGAGASLGSGCKVGTHSVVAADARIAAGVTLGRHSACAGSDVMRESLPDGAFVDPLFSGTARIVGPGYTFTPGA